MRSQVTETSRLAYHHIQSEGQLGDIQRIVWRALRDATKPHTGREIAKHTNIDGAWKRLPELERAGYATRCGSMKCSVTGRVSTAWKSAGREFEKVKTVPDFGLVS